MEALSIAALIPNPHGYVVFRKEPDAVILRPVTP
jgi:hypothetical protein